MPGKAVVMQTPDVNRQGVDFRRATVERTEILPAEALTMTAAAQRVERTVEGSGFVYAIVLDVRATAATNTAAVAFLEDAPWASLDTVVYRDVNGELVNLSGYELFIANLAHRQYASRFWDASALFRTVPGALASSGSFDFLARVPIALNRRSLRGLVGNQDRAQKYSLRTDLAASGAVYGTAPTNLPTVAIDKLYENYTVPLNTSPDGRPQEQTPADFGYLSFLTSIQNETAPAPSGTGNHFLRRIGQTVRYIALIFRAGTGTTPRAVAQANAPTDIRMIVGNDTLFHETYRYRRAQMFERYGFDFPDGVLLYDAMHDFWAGAGSEIGDDYWDTQGLVNAQFQIAYPAGFTAGGSLRILTNDLQYVPPVRSA